MRHPYRLSYSRYFFEEVVPEWIDRMLDEQMVMLYFGRDFIR